MNSRRLALFLAFWTSVAVHGAAYASLSVPPREQLRSKRVSELEFELPPLPVAEPEPRSEPTSTASDTAALRAAPAPPPTFTRPVAKVPAGETKVASPGAPVLDLSGVTLSSGSSAGFAMPVGDGSALHGPIGSGANRALGLAPAIAGSPARAPALVDARDLSERPQPPSLAGLLRANYPVEARQRGLRGSASLRARIESDGVIRSARLLSESSAGFGAACRRTVLGSRWSTPRDKNGTAVSTEIVYTCHFEIDP